MRVPDEGPISGPQRQSASSSADEGRNQWSSSALRGTLSPLPNPLEGANIHKAVLDEDLIERLGQGERVSKFPLLACRLAVGGRSVVIVVLSGHQRSSAVIVVISGPQWSSAVIVVLSGHQRS